jgi:hypothetical protein
VHHRVDKGNLIKIREPHHWSACSPRVR